MIPLCGEMGCFLKKGRLSKKKKKEKEKIRLSASSVLGRGEIWSDGLAWFAGFARCC